MNRFYINGVEYTNDVKSGLKEIDLTFEKNTTTKVVGRFISQDMGLSGEAYKLIEREFIDTCEETKEIPCRLSTDICGGINIDLSITSKGMIYNPCECQATIAPVNTSPETECHAYLSTYAWKQNLAEGGVELIRLWACMQPGMAQVLIFYLRYLILYTLIAVSGALIAGFFTAGAGAVLSLAVGALVVAFLPDIDNWISGCGRIYVAVKTSDILRFHAQACGLKFRSDIFSGGSVYDREVIVCGQAGAFMSPEQCDNDELAANILFENAPVETVEEFLNKLAPKYNAEWCIKNGCLEFTRIRANKKESYPVIYDLRKDCDGVEYEFNNEELCAFGRFEYTQALFDGEGNKAKNAYNDIVEYNPNPTTTQKGECTTIIDFAPARFMFDHITCKKEGFFDTEQIVDRFRAGQSQGIFDFIGGLFDNQGIKRECDLVLTRSNFEKCKLLILEENYDPKDAKVIRVKAEGIIQELDTDNIFVQVLGVESVELDNCYIYNYPNFFDENLPETLGESELINNFHFDRDPRLRKDKFTAGNATIECNCDLVQQIVDNNVDVYVTTHLGLASPERINIQIKDKVTVSLEQLKVCCD